MKAKVKLTDDYFIEGILRKDQKVFTALHNKYGEALKLMISRVVRDREVTNDLYQDVLLRIWKYIDKHDPSKGRLFTWMNTVAKNTALSWLKTSKRNVTHSLNSGAGCEVLNYLVDQRYFCNQPSADGMGLVNLLEQLDPLHREVLTAMYVKHLNYAETGRELNKSRGHIHVLHRTAIEELKEVLMYSNPLLQW